MFALLYQLAMNYKRLKWVTKITGSQTTNKWATITESAGLLTSEKKSGSLSTDHCRLTLAFPILTAENGESKLDQHVLRNSNWGRI